jgi:hypothetical protein
MKLTRKQIYEGLESMPMDRLLLGGAAHGVALTKKQKAFAEEVVKTGNKTAAYRKAYDTQGKPATQSRDAQKIANNPKVATYVQALEDAERAKAYLVPARLRDLAIHKITEKALDPAVPPAQQLKALELLGKITEVSLFTHRTETVHLTSSTEIKEQLMKSLRLAFQSNDVTDIDLDPAESLLAELSRGAPDSVAVVEPDAKDSVIDAVTQQESDPPDPIANAIPETPPTPTPKNEPLPQQPPLHSIPRNRFNAKSAVTKNAEPVTTGISGQGVTAVTLPRVNPNEGEGGNE